MTDAQNTSNSGTNGRDQEAINRAMRALDMWDSFLTRGPLSPSERVSLMDAAGAYWKACAERCDAAAGRRGAGFLGNTWFPTSTMTSVANRAARGSE